jgi:hypothetical protein
MNQFSLFSELLALGLRPVSPVAPVQDVELSEEWIEFEKTLGKFKEEYVKTISEMNKVEMTYNDMKEDLTMLQNFANRVNDPVLLTELTSCIQNFTSDKKLQTKKEELSLLAGKVKAMENILVNTNASRYARFTCPICMDKLVDVFLNPCGHTLCEGCLVRLRDTNCPTCRAENVTSQRLY